MGWYEIDISEIRCKGILPSPSYFNTPHCMVSNMWFHPPDPTWFRLGLFSMNGGWDYICILVALPSGWILAALHCSWQSQIAKQSIPKKDTAMLISGLSILILGFNLSATLFQKFWSEQRRKNFAMCPCFFPCKRTWLFSCRFSLDKVTQIWRCWKILEDIGRYWKILEDIGRYWKILEDIGSIWSIQITS